MVKEELGIWEHIYITQQSVSTLTYPWLEHFDGFVQQCSISSALAMEILIAVEH